MKRASRLSPSTPRRRWGRLLFLWLPLWLLAGALIWQGSYAARIAWWRTHNPDTTAFMRANLSRLQERNPEATLKHVWVDYDRISDHLKRALIVAEDAKFNEHDGFDFEAIQKALEKNQRRGKVVAGGSTISQQLAKNLFLSGERSRFRKAQEAIITVMLEQSMPKERILEIYLNVIEWGDGVFGAEAAARHYYRKSAAQLNAAEAAKLAAMVPRPKFYDRNRNTAFLNRKAQWILGQMHMVEVP
jgi:monofunctional glycosyltransferase